MKTFWKEQALDTNKKYKIDTVNSVTGNGNPWHVTNLKYNEGFKVFTFKSTINDKTYGMTEPSVVKITEVQQ